MSGNGYNGSSRLPRDIAARTHQLAAMLDMSHAMNGSNGYQMQEHHYAAGDGLHNHMDDQGVCFTKITTYHIHCVS